MRADIRPQPHLGRIEDNYKPHENMGGTLAIGKVLKVHHKHGTIDLQIIKSNDVISADPTTEGKFGARLLTSTAHYDGVLMASSGVVEPMQEGQLVLLAFLDGLKNQPVILGSFHQTWETENNVLPDIYPLKPDESLWDKREAVKYLRVHPSQFYQRIDSIGAMEMSHPSKTFLQVDPDLYGEISDAHDSYDHVDLNEKDPFTGGTRSAREEESAFPVKVLFVHRSSYDDDITTWTKFFTDSSGMFRITRDNNDETLSYFQISEQGAFTFRRQLDSTEHDSGTNYSEISLDETGSMKLERVIDGKSSYIGVDESGRIVLSHLSGKSMVIDDGFDGIGGGGTGMGFIVSRSEPKDVPNHTMWVDISDLEE
jgi:hypothetical protein